MVVVTALTPPIGLWTELLWYGEDVLTLRDLTTSASTLEALRTTAFSILGLRLRTTTV